MASSNFIISGPEENYDLPEDIALGKLILQKLQERERDAVVNINGFTDEVITCGEVLDDSLKVIHFLKSLGLKKGDVVAVISENSITYCIPVIASLFLGVVANLLNPAYTTRELKHALTISKPKLVFCERTVLDSVKAVQKDLEFIENIIVLDKSNNNIVDVDVQLLDDILKNIPVDIELLKEEEVGSAEDGALILLSSGTTGLPKGVLLTHNNFRVPIGVVPDPRFGSVQPNKDSVLTAIPMFHVFGVTIALLTIIYSAKLIVMNKFHPDTYLRCIEKYRVAVLPLVPPILLFIAKYPLTKNFELSSVKRLYCGAAPLGKDVEQGASQVLVNARVQQVYGITEVTGMCTFAPTNQYKPGSAGILIPHLQAKVVDPKTGEALGPLQTGEFCFRGSNVMKGYVGTETNDIDENGFYHTGDVGYYDEDGFLFVTDRIKELIKYKGFQVSPTELEQLILTHPAVKDCGVVGIEDERAGQLPLAFVALQNGVVVSEKDIIDFVAERISVHKHLQGGVRFIKEIPKNPSGKILRRQLLDIYNNSH